MGRQNTQYKPENLCGSLSLPMEPQDMLDIRLRLTHRQDRAQAWHKSFSALKWDTVFLPFPRNTAGS